MTDTTHDTDDVDGVLRAFLVRIGKAREFGPATALYGEDGGALGLDSLETAELSAVLEDEFGRDPFSSGPMPQTVGELTAFYESVASAN